GLVELLSKLSNLALQHLGIRRNPPDDFKEFDGARKVPGALLQARQVQGNVMQRLLVGFLFRGFLSSPFAQGELPDIAGPCDVAVVLSIEAAQLEENFVAVGIGAPAFAEKILSFLYLAQVAKPIGGHGISVNTLWIQFGRETEPGQHLAFL